MQENLPLDIIIELTDCTIWQQDHLVFSNINFRVGKGEFLYLVGRVGSGKSSLIKTLNAQIPLKQGIGLVAMRERAELMGGVVEFLRPGPGAQSGSGTLVRLRVPREKLDSYAG